MQLRMTVASLMAKDPVCTRQEQLAISICGRHQEGTPRIVIGTLEECCNKHILIGN